MSGGSLASGEASLVGSLDGIWKPDGAATSTPGSGVPSTTGTGLGVGVGVGGTIRRGAGVTIGLTGSLGVGVGVGVGLGVGLGVGFGVGFGVGLGVTPIATVPAWSVASLWPLARAVMATGCVPVLIVPDQRNVTPRVQSPPAVRFMVNC